MAPCPILQADPNQPSNQAERGAIQSNQIKNEKGGEANRIRGEKQIRAEERGGEGGLAGVVAHAEGGKRIEAGAERAEVLVEHRRRGGGGGRRAAAHHSMWNLDVGFPGGTDQRKVSKELGIISYGNR